MKPSCRDIWDQGLKHVTFFFFFLPILFSFAVCLFHFPVGRLNSSLLLQRAERRGYNVLVSKHLFQISKDIDWLALGLGLE